MKYCEPCNANWLNGIGDTAGGVTERNTCPRCDGPVIEFEPAPAGKIMDMMSEESARLRSAERDA